MGSKFVGFAFGVAAISLASCASVENKPLDKAQAGKLRTIALLRIYESRFAGVRDFSGLSALGGAVGGAVSDDTDAKRSQKFVAEYNNSKVRLASLMLEELREGLAAGGLEVSYLSEEKPTLKDGAADYTNITTAADAILNVWYGPTAYVQPRFSTRYEPWLVVHARLVNAKTKETLYRKTFSGGYETIIANTVFVSCSKGTRYDSFDALMQNHAKAVEALAECQKAVVRQIVADLK